MALHRMMVDGVSVSVCCSMDMELYVVVYCVCVVRMGCVFVVRCSVRARKYPSRPPHSNTNLKKSADHDVRQK